MAEPSIASTTILRGRADQQAAIAELLKHADAGQGGALLLHGEVGMGKSALLKAAMLDAESFTVLTTTGSETESRLPFAGLHRLLAPVLAHASRLPKAQAAALSIAIETGECADGDEFALSAAVFGLLRSAAEQRPVLGCIDDAHWVDRPSLETLAFVARRASIERIALLFGVCDSASGTSRAAEIAAATSGSNRPTAAKPATAGKTATGKTATNRASGKAANSKAASAKAANLKTVSAMTLTVGDERARPTVDPLAGVPRLHLVELDHRTSRQVLADLVHDGLAGDVAGVLATVAGGNPLALADLARSLSPEQRRGEATPPTSLPPESALRCEIRDRLNRLPQETRWLVLLAAVDEDLDVGGLIRAAKESGLMVDALAPAELSNVVRVQGSELTFPQPLVRTIAYDEATLAQRRAAHTLLARTLDPDVHPLRRALHLAAVAEGPDPDLAAELVRAAGIQRSARAAASRALECAAHLSTCPIEAATHLVAAARHAWEGGEPHRARMLLRRVRRSDVPHRINAQAELLLGEIEMRSGATTHARQTLLAAAGDLSEDRQLALSALMRAGEALCLTGDYARYGDLSRRALAMRGRDEPAGAELLFEQFAGLTAMFRGNYRQGEAPLRRVLELANELDDALALIRASMAAVVLGDDAQAYRLAVRAVAVARATGDASSVPQALELAAAAEIALGRYGAATATLLEGLPLARETGQETLASNIAATIGMVAATMGDRETCLRYVSEARAHTASHGVNRCQAIIDWSLALLDLTSGRPAEALARLQALMMTKSGRGQLVIQVAATPHLVEAAVRCGEKDAVVRTLGLFEAWAQRTANPAWLAMLARCHALMADTEAEADKHFREALQQHQAAESEFERARTELLYGQELRRGRRPSAAREHLRSALETFQRFDAVPWVAQATAELRAAGDHVEHLSQPIADALTPQQLQIARLAASGATNREVAKQMFLSTRTVDHHMRNIFARLGIRSRVDLAKLMV